MDPSPTTPATMRRMTPPKTVARMMAAGIEAMDHFTMKTTMLQNGIRMSVTTTGDSGASPPGYGSRSHMDSAPLR